MNAHALEDFVANGQRAQRAADQAIAPQTSNERSNGPEQITTTSHKTVSSAGSEPDALSPLVTDRVATRARLEGSAEEHLSQSRVSGLKSKVAAPEDGGTPKTRPRALNPTRFLCREEVRKFLLEYAQENRAHKWDRVSEETLVALNEIVRAAAIGHVKRAPSKGKTL